MNRESETNKQTHEKTVMIEIRIKIFLRVNGGRKTILFDQKKNFRYVKKIFLMQFITLWKITVTLVKDKPIFQS